MNDNPDTNTSSDTNEPPKPKLMLDHTPGFVHEEHTDQGDIVLFRSTQPDFRLDFQADISWFTEGDPQTALSFYMEPSGNNYWQFTDPTSQAIWRTIAGNSNAGWTTSARYANTCNAAIRNCRCWNADPHTRRIPASHQKNGGTHDRQKETRQTLQGHVAVHRSLRESKGEPMPRNKHGKPASLEDRYLSELGQGGERDDMLQALCRIADQLKRSNDIREPKHEPK